MIRLSSFQFSLAAGRRSLPLSRQEKIVLIQAQGFERRIDMFEMNVERAKTIDFRR